MKFPRAASEQVKNKCVFFRHDRGTVSACFSLVSCIVGHPYASSFKSGKRRDNTTKVVASIATMAYTKFPPKTLYCLDTANKEAIDAGPSARAMDVKLWLRPFTEPRDCLLGAALVIKTKMAATHTGEIDTLND